MNEYMNKYAYKSVSVIFCLSVNLVVYCSFEKSDIILGLLLIQ
jgi:hypothetical protein